VLTTMMEEASNLNVRLKAESGIGKDWYSAK
jgi:DNA polymerase I-like protein with 3'-5' exonuclease and polymerase domains